MQSQPVSERFRDRMKSRKLIAFGAIEGVLGVITFFHPAVLATYAIPAMKVIAITYLGAQGVVDAAGAYGQQRQASGNAQPETGANAETA